MKERFKKLPLGTVPVKIIETKKSYSGRIPVHIVQDNKKSKNGFFVFSLLFFILSLVVTNYGISDNGNQVALASSTKEEVKQIDKFKNIQEVLNLDGCKITQDEDSHIIKGNGSMYAVDISCGEAIKVFAPKDKKFYRVKTVSFDKRIGDYIILKHGELEYVYGHTKSSLKKGDRVESGKEIGVTNNSGEWDGYHLHFEVWKYGYNISYKYLLGEKEKYNREKTYALRKQRGWYLAEKEAMDFIADFEGFRAVPYEDGNRLSIGYGTKAKGPNDRVTREEAKKRKMVVVENIMENIYKYHFVKTHNQRIALASALYNKGINSKIAEVKKKKNSKEVKKFLLQDWVIMKGSKYEKGLKKRYELTAKKYLDGFISN